MLNTLWLDSYARLWHQTRSFLWPSSSSLLLLFLPKAVALPPNINLKFPSISSFSKSCSSAKDLLVPGMVYEYNKDIKQRNTLFFSASVSRTNHAHSQMLLKKPKVEFEDTLVGLFYRKQSGNVSVEVTWEQGNCRRQRNSRKRDRKCKCLRRFKASHLEAFLEEALEVWIKTIELSVTQDDYRSGDLLTQLVPTVSNTAGIHVPCC